MRGKHVCGLFEVQMYLARLLCCFLDVQYVITTFCVITHSFSFHYETLHCLVCARTTRAYVRNRVSV